MGERHILFVEDDPGIIDLMEMAVGRWNAEKPDRVFRLEICETADDARGRLERVRYDFALFDLRLPDKAKGKSTEPRGNELAVTALDTCGIPVAIMSGNPNDLDQRLRKSKMVKVFNKGDKSAYNEAVGWFGSFWEMAGVVAAARKRIRKASAEIFAGRLWPHWKDFTGLDLESGEGTSLTDIVTRQYAGHVAEMLGNDGPDAVKWHPFETYVMPSLWDHRAHTGDIFEFGEDLWVVLTPACDMANGNVSRVLLARCLRGEQDWKGQIAKLSVDATAEKASKYFRKLTNQQQPPGISKHFLSPLPGTIEPLLVDFADIDTRPFSELAASLANRKASLSAPFLQNLTQRFGTYASRVGQPDIDVMFYKPKPEADS